MAYTRRRIRAGLCCTAQVRFVGIADITGDDRHRKMVQCSIRLEPAKRDWSIAYHFEVFTSGVYSLQTFRVFRPEIHQ